MSSAEPKSYLAFDLGASTSRALLGTLRGSHLELDELFRFSTPVLEIEDHLFWDIDAMWAAIQTGFERAKSAAPELRSLSVDSWAVDYVPLDGVGHPLRNPHCYRDKRTDGVMEQAFDVVPATDIYSITGIQFLPFNTLYQVLADAQQEGYGGATLLLPIADYFNYRFSGFKTVDVSMASTTQLMDANTRQWSYALMQRFGLDTSVWPKIVLPGTRLGPATLDPAVEVIVTCSHDTGAAVAATPAAEPGDTWAYISCGTWSLMGVERDTPLLTEEARQAGFTNEAGLDGTIRFLKNLTGLWVLQECMREWCLAESIEWPDLEREARAVKASGTRGQGDTLIDLEDAVFLPRGPMEHRIHGYCRDQDLPELKSRGEIVFTILSSIAASYKRTLSELESVTGTVYDRIHLFGGGSLNQLLCQLTADVCGCQVIAGPAEVTAMGNLLIQARTMGDLPAGASIRELSAASSDLTVYSPESDN